jgi:ubiquinone/menaquinone biosynthesis C-methylase UbiE
VFDIVYASHVLEHIKEDSEAISEIRRVVKPGGIAVLPVPIVGNETIEYPEENPYEFGHVRAPGPDYFEKYRKFFSKVDTYQSMDFPDTYQTFVYEDRRNWPETMLWRPKMDGDKHVDMVPVCYA